MIEKTVNGEFYVRLEAETPNSLLQKINGMVAKFHNDYDLKMISTGPGLKGMLHFKEKEKAVA